MPRNRRKKSQVHTLEHSASKPTLQSPPIKPSAAAQKIADRIFSGGEAYLMKNFERIMIDSKKLADEPEFADLNFNRDQSVQITERWLKKNENRLKEAERKSQKEFRRYLDDMKIEIVYELSTPAFRKDVKKRLRAMNDRVLATNDAKKIELIMILQPLMDMKDFPWGLCGLILAVYNRTLKEELQTYQDENEIFGAVTEALKEAGEKKINVRNIMHFPQKVEQVAEKVLAKNPGMRERLEKKIWEMTYEFENELRKGNITLDLFTKEELVLPFQRLEEELGMPITQVKQTEEISKRIFDVMRQAIKDFMTPERLLRMRKDIESTSEAWLRGKQKWAAAIQAELVWLDRDTYEENPFFLSAFLGQLQRSGKVLKTGLKSK